MEMPVKLSEGVVQELALLDVAQQLRGSDEYATNGRTAQTVVKAPEMNLVLVVVAADAKLAEHQAPASATLVMLDGRITFSSEDAESQLGAGQAVAFAAAVPHSVSGVEDSAFLLVIATA